MTVLEKIRQRGHWNVEIRPVNFADERLQTLAEVEQVVRDSIVSIRGWNFPHWNNREEPQRGLDWAGQDFEWNHYLELWRMFKSGLFIHVAGLPEDWRDQSGLWPANADWTPGQTLAVGGTLYRLLEIFTFASRLALTKAGDDTMHIEFAIAGLANRSLVADDPRRAPFMFPMTAQQSEFPYAVDVPRERLVAEPADQVPEPARRLFELFHWDVSTDFIREYLKSMRR